MYDGSYGSKYDEYSQLSKNKREIPKSNKGYHWKYQSQYYSLQHHKQDKETMTTSIHCPNGGPRIKPGKEIRCIKFEKEK